MLLQMSRKLKSGAYVNGLLDVIAKKLMAEKVLTKTIN